MTGKRLRRWISVAIASAVAVQGFGSPVHADGWDYVYGDPGPANYSRYQDVEIAPDGSVFTAGFFSGAFNGLSSPDAYRYFVQHISTTGATLWTKEVPTGVLSTQVVPAAPDVVVDGLGNAIFRLDSSFWSYDATGSSLGTLVLPGNQPVGFQGSAMVPALDGGAVIVLRTLGQPTPFIVQHLRADLSVQWTFDLASLVDVATGCGFCAQPAVLGVSDGTFWVVGQKNKVLATQQNALSMVHLSATGAKLTSILHNGLMPAVMANSRNPILAATDSFIWITVQSGPGMVTPLPVMSFATSDGLALGQVDAKLPSEVLTTSRGTVDCGKLDIASEYPLNFDLPPFPPEVSRRALLLNGTRLVVAARCTNIGIPPPASATPVYAVLLLSYSLNSPLGGGYSLNSWREMSSTSTIYAMDADDAGNAIVVGSTTDGVVYSGPIARPTTEATGNERAVATRNPLGNLKDIGEYEGLTPVRLFDTRPGEAQGAVSVVKAKVGGANVLTVKVAGKLGVPANGAGAVSLNVTVVDSDGPGFLTVFPCGTPPNASNLNFVKGQTVANAVLAPLSANGEVCFAANVGTHVLADVNGWFRAGLGFNAVSPVRLFDSRPDQPHGAIQIEQRTYGGAAELRVKVTGVGGVPATGVGAVSLNVTAVDPSAAGFVTVYPCGQRPNASNLNFTGGQTVPNAVIAPVSPTTGEVCVYSNVATHLLADVNGWFSSTSSFHALTPVRLVDTRAGEAQGAISVPKQKYSPSALLRVKVTGAGGVPATGVGAVALNVTVTDPDAAGFVTAFPCGTQPLASNVNFGANQVVPNAVLVPVNATTGEVCFFSNVPANILVDVNGWIAG